MRQDCLVMFVARRILIGLLLFLVAGCVSSGPASGPPGDTIFANSATSGKYAGADAGYLILALAAQKGTAYNDYKLFFRKRDRSIDGSVWWGQGNPFDQRKLDLDDSVETGIVDVRRLPPGDYEIFNFLVFMNAGTVQESWRSKQDFSIPFSIEPGRATYVGEFDAAKLTGKGLFGMTVPDGAYFVLSDKTARDVAIARQKEPGLTDVVTVVADPSTLGNPLISATLH